MYQHIVLAADGSTNSLRAAKEAATIAKAFQAKITVVFVVELEQARQEVMHAASHESLYLERRQKLAGVEEILQTEQIQFVTILLKGSPGPEIVKFVNEQDADLVIIGSRGLNSLQEMVLGSVSHKVMKRVNCPAMIVK